MRGGIEVGHGKSSPGVWRRFNRYLGGDIAAIATVDRDLSCGGRHSGAMQSIEPRISRYNFEIPDRRFAPSGNDESLAGCFVACAPCNDAVKQLTSMTLFAKISAHNDERTARLAGIGLMLLAVFTFSFGDAIGKFMVATYSVGRIAVAARLRGAASVAAAAMAAAHGFRAVGAAMVATAPRRYSRRRRSLLFSSRRFICRSLTSLPITWRVRFSSRHCRRSCCASASAGGAGLPILVGFCGVLIALHPSPQTVSWPALIALGGSTSFAVLMLITRSLRATPDVVLASTQFAGTFVFGALLSPIGWVTP